MRADATATSVGADPASKDASYVTVDESVSASRRRPVPHSTFVTDSSSILNASAMVRVNTLNQATEHSAAEKPAMTREPDVFKAPLETVQVPSAQST
jgi:hypothetical protein